MQPSRRRPRARIRRGYLSSIVVVAALAFGGQAAQAATAASKPKVVASILPVHGLVAGVMAGMGSPRILIRGGASPHHYALRPSETRALARADVVFWVGPGLEGYLEKPIRSLAAKARIVALSELPGLVILPARRTAEFKGRGAGQPSGAGKSNVADPHIWLDPRNAMAMADGITRALAGADPANGARYRANAKELRRRIESLAGELTALFGPVKDKPYLVYHDAFQYFERRFALAAIGAVTPSEESQPGPRRLRRLQALVRRHRVRCIFIEAGAAAPLVKALDPGGVIRRVKLDPLGVRVAPGPDHYVTMMRANARAMVRCLNTP